jgi:hypothetical protein
MRHRPATTPDWIISDITIEFALPAKFHIVLQASEPFLRHSKNKIKYSKHEDYTAMFSRNEIWERWQPKQRRQRYEWPHPKVHQMQLHTIAPEASVVR